MSLINCPECKKEISDKAASCPNCGMPFSQMTQREELIQCPEFPDELLIGNGVFPLKGFCDGRENVVESIRTGEVRIFLHTHGLELFIFGSRSKILIHNSQIISIKKSNRSELINLDKSVIGRAIVGGLILGPLGAVIGGMSGISKKEKIKDKSFLVINYWEITTKQAQTILVSAEEHLISTFIDKYKHEASINNSTGRQAISDNISYSYVFVILLIFTSVVVIGVMILR